MSHYNSINQRKVYGPPPTYYKQITKLPFSETNMMKPPNLDLLTKDDRNYYLSFQGGIKTPGGQWGIEEFDEMKIPIKWK